MTNTIAPVTISTPEGEVHATAQITVPKPKGESVFNKDSIGKNVAKSQEVLAKEAERKERQHVMLSPEEQEALDKARASYRDVVPSTEKSQAQKNSIEADQVLPQSRNYAEKIIQQWAQRVNSGPGSPVVVELGNTTDKGIIVEFGKDARWHVVLPNPDCKPPTLKEFSEAVRKIAPYTDEKNGMDGMQSAQTETFGNDLIAVAIDIAQNKNSTVPDTVIQDISATGEAIRNSIHEQYGTRIPGMLPKDRAGIAAQHAITPVAREETVRQLTQDVQHMVEQEEKSGQKESVHSNEPMDFRLQILMQEARFMAGNDVSLTITTRNEVTVTRSPDGKISVSMPGNPDLDTVVKLAREYAKLSKETNTTRRIEEFSQRLQDAGLLMSQQGFSEESVAAVYSMGQRLQASLHPENDSLLQPKTAEQIRQEANAKTFTNDEQRDIYMDMLYGRGVVLEVKGKMRESFYERRFVGWRNDTLQKDPNADVTREAYEQDLMKRIQENARYRSLVKRAIERSIEAGATGRAQSGMEQVALQRAHESISQAQVDEWIQAVHDISSIPSDAFTQSIHERLAEARINGATTSLQEIEAITHLLQSPNIVDKLTYAPAAIRAALLRGEPSQPSVPGEQLLWEMACNFKEAYAVSAFEKLGYDVAYKVDGFHVYLVMEVDGKLLRVDVSTPRKIDVDGAITELSGVTEIPAEQQQAARDALANKKNNNQTIASTLYHNAAIQLRDSGGDSAVVTAMLRKSVMADPNNAAAWLALGERANAIAIDPDIEAKSNATGGKIGAWVPTPEVFKTEISSILLTPLDPAIQPIIKGLQVEVGAVNKIDDRSLRDAIVKIAAMHMSGTPLTGPNLDLLTELQAEWTRREQLAQWEYDEHESFQFVLEVAHLRQLRAYPKAFLAEQLDQIYLAVAQGQSAESQGVGTILGVVEKGAQYLHAKGRKQEALQLIEDLNTMKGIIFTRSSFESRSSENMLKNAQSLKAAGLLNTFALDEGAVAQYHSRFLSLLRDKRLRDDPSGQFITPKMITDTLVEMQQEQLLLARKGIGVFGAYQAVREQFPPFPVPNLAGGPGRPDMKLVINTVTEDIRSIKIGTARHNSLFTKYGIYDDRFELYAQELDRANHDFLTKQEIAEGITDINEAKENRMKKVFDSVKLDLEASVRRVALNALDATKVDQQLYVLLSGLKEHKKGNEAYMSELTSIFTFLNPEDLNTDKWGAMTAYQLQEMELAKVASAQEYIARYHIADIDENDIGAQLRLGKLLNKNIISADDYFSGGMRNLYLLDQWENMFIYKAALREYQITHPNNFKGLSTLEVERIVDGWKKRNPGSEEFARLDYNIRTPGGGFDKLKGAQKAKVIRDYKLLHGKRPLDMIRDNAAEFGLFMRPKQDAEDRPYRTVTRRETWGKVQTYSPQFIIRLYQEQNVLLLNGEPEKDCLDDLNSKLTHETRMKPPAYRVTDCISFNELYGNAIWHVQEAAMRPKDAWVDPRKIDFSLPVGSATNALTIDEARAITDILDAEGKVGDTAELQLLIGVMQTYITSNDLITPLIQDCDEANIDKPDVCDPKILANGGIRAVDALRFADLYQHVAEIDLPVDLLEQPDNLAHGDEENELKMNNASYQWRGDSGGDIFFRNITDAANAEVGYGGWFKYYAARDWQGRMEAFPEMTNAELKIDGIPAKLRLYKHILIPMLKAGQLPMLADALGVDTPWFRGKWTELQKINGPQEKALTAHELRSMVDIMRPDLIDYLRAMPMNTPDEVAAREYAIREAEDIFRQVESDLNIGWLGFVERKSIGFGLLAFLLLIAEGKGLTDENLSLSRR